MDIRNKRILILIILIELYYYNIVILNLIITQRTQIQSFIDVNLVEQNY